MKMTWFEHFKRINCDVCVPKSFKTPVQYDVYDVKSGEFVVHVNVIYEKWTEMRFSYSHCDLKDHKMLNERAHV